MTAPSRKFTGPPYEPFWVLAARARAKTALGFQQWRIQIMPMTDAWLEHQARAMIYAIIGDISVDDVSVFLRPDSTARGRSDGAHDALSKAVFTKIQNSRMLLRWED